jgi:AcrR family transcriptional regulator
MEPVKDAPGRTYGGQTSDERLQERRDALLAAAFALVAQDGWRALRIDALCREAQLNKRYFYESFEGGLDALIAELTRRLAGDAIAATLGAMDAGLPAQEAIRQGIAAFVAHLTDDPRRARVLFGAVPAGHAAAGHQADALRRLINTAATVGNDMHQLGADPLVDTAAAMLVGGTSQALLDWLDGRIASDQAQLVEDLVVLWQAISDGVGRLGKR